MPRLPVTGGRHGRPAVSEVLEQLPVDADGRQPLKVFSPVLPPMTGACASRGRHANSHNIGRDLGSGVGLCSVAGQAPNRLPGQVPAAPRQVAGHGPLRLRRPRSTMASSRPSSTCPMPRRVFTAARRFDWSGVIGSLEYKGHRYYGPWFTKTDPTVTISFTKARISSPGPAAPSPGRWTSSRPTTRPLGYDEAKAGRDIHQDRRGRPAQAARRRRLQPFSPLRNCRSRNLEGATTARCDRVYPRPRGSVVRLWVLLPENDPTRPRGGRTW